MATEYLLKISHIFHLRNIASVFGAMAALIGDKKIVLQRYVCMYVCMNVFVIRYA